MHKRTTIKIIIYVALLLIIFGVLTWWFMFNATRARDYQRLGDMRVLESEMNNYFFKFNTYIVPECPVGSPVNFCVGRDGEVLSNVSNLIDPINSESLRYIVSELSDENFRVEFYLEGGVAGLSSGRYALTKEGLGQ